MTDQSFQMTPVGGFARPKPPIILSALYGGAVIGILFGVPYLNFINCCCCAGVLAGGVLSVFFYKKDLAPGMPPLESADALKVGALAGAFGGVIGTIVVQLFQLLSGRNTKEELETVMDQMSGREGEAMMRMMMSFFDSPFFVFLSLLISVILCTVFGLLGGLIGYALFKPKQTAMPSNQLPMQP